MLSSNELKLALPLCDAAAAAAWFAPLGCPAGGPAELLVLIANGLGFPEVETGRSVFPDGPALGVCKCGIGPLAVEAVLAGGLAPFVAFCGRGVMFVERLTISFPWTTRLSFDFLRSRVRISVLGESVTLPIHTLADTIGPTVSTDVQINHITNAHVDDA